MAALTGTQISVTYVGLLKTSANTVLSSTAQQMTDGSGNNSILYLSTAEVGIGGSPTAGKELDVTGNVLITGDLQVDNINIDGNTISATSGVVTLQDGTIATTQSQSDNSTKVATTAYVDAAVTAEDLDFAGGSGTGSVDLDSQTFTIAGTSNEIETSASGQTLTIGLPDDVTVTGELTVSGTGQSSFGGQVTIPATPSASTDAASKGYVDSQVGANNELSEVLANGNTTGGTDIAVSSGDDITFTSTSKAIFGGSSDLQVYSDGSNNYVDSTSNELRIRSNDLRLLNYGTGKYITADSGADVSLYYNNSKKFETTSTGVQVTGSNLSVIAGSGATKLQFVQTDGNWKIEAGGGTNQLVIHSESLVEDYVTIKGGGVVQLNDYGSGNNTGTVAKNLAVDSSGNIIETDGGVVDGSGTANDVAMWSDSNTLTDAPIAISGNDATFAGDVNIGGSVSSPAGVGTILGVVGRNGVGGGTAGIVLKDYDNDGWDIWNSGGGLNFRYNNDASVGFGITSSGATTFAGNVNIENASTPLLTIKDTTNNVNILIGADDNNTFLRGSSGSLILQTNGANAALTLDASQNATFAGTVTAPKFVGSGTAAVFELIQSTTGAATYYVMDNTAETGGKRYRFGYTGGSLDKGSFTIYNETDSLLPLLISGANSTFAGTIAVGGATPTTNAIEINGADGTSYVFFKSAVATTGARVGLNGDDLRVFNQQAAGELHLGTNGATKLTIDSSGNVGIGGSPSEILQTNKNSAGNIVGGYFTNSQANTGAESVSLAFGLNRSGGDFVRQVKAITFGAEQQWTGTPSTVDGYLAFSTISNETVSERLRITSGGDLCVGVTTAQGKIHMHNSGTSYLHISNDTTGSGSGSGTDIGVFTGQSDLQINNREAASVIISTSDTPRLTVNSSGNIGIGESSASYKLRVKSDATLDNGIYLSAGSSSSNHALYVENLAGSAEYFAVRGDGQIRMAASGTGNVRIGIGTSATGHLTIEQSGNHLHLRNGSQASGRYWNFDVASDSKLYILNEADTGVYIAHGATSWTANSDESLKENIKPLQNVLDKIKDYRCIEYNLKSDKTKGKKIGFIAQDWENDFAPIINKDDEGLLGMKYTETIPVLLKAIQELKAEIETLKSQINN